jgi:TolB protein
VQRGRDVELRLNLTCSPTTGYIRLAVVSSGIDRQESRFIFQVDDNALSTGDSSAVTFSRLAPGIHVASLLAAVDDSDGLRSNCRVVGDNPRSVTVAVGDTTQVTMNVTCTARPNVTVSVTTTGTEIDADGYVLSLSGPFEADAQWFELPIPTSGTNATRSLAPGTYAIALTGVAGNCYPPGRAFRQVVITQDTTLSVAVRCEPSRQLAYVAGEGDYADILVASTSGVLAGRLTSNTVADSNPAWSPDGRHLAFTSHRSGNGDIYMMDTDGSNVRRLTTSNAPDFQPTWSSDGARIAYASARGGNVDVYVIQADGSGEQRLTADPGDDRDPAWSPTGGRIAFVSTRDGGGMFTMSPDGSDVRLLAANGLSPAWSPAGDRIAFSLYNSNVNNPWPGATLTVVIVNSDGSGMLRLDDAESWFSAANLSWGADGRIAFLVPRSTAWTDAYTITGVQSDGTGMNSIVTDAVDPAWRP